MSRKYWKQRSAWDMYQFMEDAEETADLIARVYRKASLQLEYAARDIFEKFMTKYGLSETEAWQIINSIQDKNSIDQLKQELQNRKKDSEILKQLEAPAYRARLERLQDLMSQVDTVMQQVYQQEKQFDTKLLEQLGEKAYYHSIYNMQKETGLAFNFSHVSRKQIDQALQMKWSGKHFSDRIWQNTQQLADSLKDELLISLLTGRTDRETAESIQAQCGGGAKQARRLVRTESCYMAGELTAQSYIDCGIKNYRYVAVLDLRTSKICRELDGKVFPVKDRKAGVNYPPMHPYCRSTTISVIDDKILRNMKRSAYNPETGRTEMVPADMTYKQWYEKYVKGNPKAEAQEKAVKNAASDRKQYDQYRELLKKDMPKHFADFQEMKYNEPEKWEKLQRKYQDTQLQEKIRSKDYPKQIEEGKQGKHILGHNNYIDGRSYLTTDIKETKDLVNKYAGTGKIQRDRQGHWNHKEVVTMRKNIGVYKDLKGNELPTDIATIHYSKNGVHVVPAKPREK